MRERESILFERSVCFMQAQPYWRLRVWGESSKLEDVPAFVLARSPCSGQGCCPCSGIWTYPASTRLFAALGRMVNEIPPIFERL